MREPEGDILLDIPTGEEEEEEEEEKEEKRH